MGGRRGTEEAAGRGPAPAARPRLSASSPWAPATTSTITSSKVPPGTAPAPPGGLPLWYRRLWGAGGAGVGLWGCGLRKTGIKNRDSSIFRVENGDVANRRSGVCGGVGIRSGGTQEFCCLAALAEAVLVANVVTSHNFFYTPMGKLSKILRHIY